MEYEVERVLGVLVQTSQGEIHLLKVSVPPAASDSPSQPKSEKPNEPSTCGAGESAEPECSGHVAGRHKWLTECDYCGDAESAPRKVWAVKGIIAAPVRTGFFQLYSSREAASHAVTSDPDAYTITEYEVADG